MRKVCVVTVCVCVCACVERVNVYMYVYLHVALHKAWLSSPAKCSGGCQSLGDTMCAVCVCSLNYYYSLDHSVLLSFTDVCWSESLGMGICAVEVVCGSGVCCVCEYLHILYAEYCLWFEGQ